MRKRITASEKLAPAFRLKKVADVEPPALRSDNVDFDLSSNVVMTAEVVAIVKVIVIVYEWIARTANSAISTSGFHEPVLGNVIIAAGTSSLLPRFAASRFLVMIYPRALNCP